MGASLRKRMEQILNIASLIFLVVIGAMITKKFLSPGMNQQHAPSAVALPQMGGLGNFNWSAHHQTLVFALQTGCHFCAESVPFHQILVKYSRATDTGVLALFPNSQSQAKAVLEAEHLPFSDGEIKEANLGSLSISGTPTLLLVDNRGRTIRRWSGRLSPQQEHAVMEEVGIAKLADNDNEKSRIDLASDFFHVDYASLDEFKRLASANYPSIVDVRSRDLYAKSHIEGALNIPLDELSIRAVHELPTSKEVGIFCQYHSDCEVPYQKKGLLTNCTQSYFLLRKAGFSNIKLVDTDINSAKSSGMAISYGAKFFGEREISQRITETK